MENFSHQIQQANTDEWYTPKEYVDMIVPYILNKGYKRILCPFDKAESQYPKVLQRNGLEVIYSHIETGKDFFEYNNLKDFDAVVSNPPFSKRTEILRKLFSADIPFALIINMNGLFDSKERWELFKQNKFELLIPSGRMKFFNENGVGNSPNFQSIYVCKGMLDKQIEFARFEEEQIEGQMSIFDYLGG